MIDVGYRVIYYSDYRDEVGSVIHETQVSGDKLASGALEQSLSDISTFAFDLMYDHPFFNKIKPINGLVKIINKFDKEVEFYGRVLKPEGDMDQSGLFTKSFICESVLGYLNDSTQTFQKIANSGVRDYFTRIIDYHNSQVEPHKRFKVGQITVSSSSDTLYRYIGYDTTFKTIKDYLIGQFGGYIQLRLETDGMYIDYLSEVGQERQNPIKLGENIETVSQSIDLTEMITRLVPLGADLDTGTSDVDTGQYTSKQRVTIETVNGGKRYIEDQDLVKIYGIIQKPIDWTEISDPATLLARGKQYMSAQKIAVSSWSTKVVELYLINKNFEKFRVGNTYPIDTPPLAGIEKLQIIKKVIDITHPESVDLTVGADSLTLSQFQLQQQEANKSMQKVLSQQAAAAAAAQAQAALNNQIALLQTELSGYQAMSDSYQAEIATLEAQIAGLNSQDDAALIKTLQAQIEVARTKKQSYDVKIAEVTGQINELKGGN